MTDDRHPVIGNIEDTKALMDIGKMGYFILQGAIEAGASDGEGYAILLAHYTAMFESARLANKEEDEETPSS